MFIHLWVGTIGPYTYPSREIFMLVTGMFVVAGFFILGYRRVSSLLMPMTITFLLFYSCQTLTSRIPAGWFVLDRGTNLFNGILSLFHKGDINFSHTQMGVPVIASLIFFWIVSLTLSERVNVGRYMVILFLFLFLFLFNTFLFSFFPFTERHALTRAINSVLPYQPLFLLILEMIPFSIFLLMLMFTFPPKRWLRVTLCVGVSLLLFAATIGVVLLFQQKETSHAKKGAILFFNKANLVNYASPQRGQYGIASSGMFGEIVRYLAERDFATSVTSVITQPLLENCSTFVVINLSETLTEVEQAILMDHVEEGGSLLVLGDHTDVGGILTPLNNILEPADIHFNFDSALPSKGVWRGCLTLCAHPANEGLNRAEDFNISVGASLDVGFGSRPLIIGRYSIGDMGNYENKERAFLGDYEYDKGERSGDTVLAAEGKIGKGEVLVFGDTSPFQNLSLFATRRFMDNIFSYLTGRGNPRPLEPEKVAFVDDSHCGRFLHTGDIEGSLNALTLSIMRMRRFVFLCDSVKEIHGCSLYIVVAPTRDFAHDEVERICDFIDTGGTLLIAQGYDEYCAAPRLLDTFGFSVMNIPLGPVETQAFGHEVEFVSAWPLTSTNSSAEVIAKGWDYPIAAVLNRGRGRVVVVSDSRFLLSENLELKEYYYEGNVKFLEELLDMVWNTPSYSGGKER